MSEMWKSNFIALNLNLKGLKDLAPTLTSYLSDLLPNGLFFNYALRLYLLHSLIYTTRKILH